uniref:ubiquitinyl hydrolase 1 n=1 Tax=Cyprinus carpio carpio TaxID=630221 RepID=A0A9J7WVX9_CYPCA
MASADNNIYFIITANPPSPNSNVKAGEICFIDKQQFDLWQKRNDTKILPVVCIGTPFDVYLNEVLLQQLKPRSAELLLALESNEMRLLALKDPEALKEASNLTEGSRVYVDYKGQWLKGVIRYVGGLSPSSCMSDPIRGVFFGVELQEGDKNKGQNDGSYLHKIYFTCPKNSGIFAPFTRIKPVDHKPSGPPLPTQSSLSMTSTEPLKVGDRVTFLGKINDHHGMIMDIKDSPDGKMVLISTHTFCFVLFCFSDETEKMDTSQGSEMGGVTDFDEINVGSLVQILGKKLSYGIVRWVGCLPDCLEKIAGLELEDSSAGVTDGTYKGKRYFNCPPHCGLFVKLSSCRPDDRFSDHNGAIVYEEQENVPPIKTEDVSKRLIGKRKGIQGHYNSCYMDSALFRLELILDTVYMEILFLQLTFNLCKKKKKKNQSGSRQKVQSCYYYQIFMDYNHHLVLPTVQQLLEHSFYSNSLKLAEVPACLILTMPRSGKSFKMFPKIIPSTELDITGLLTDGPQQCVLCGQLANEECAECFRETVFGDTGFKYFCLKCSAQVHSHQQRRCHNPSSLLLPQGFSYSQSSGSDRRTPPQEKLELFAVLCIETSHYVSFVKYGPQDTDWIFFDSMADRVGEIDGYNIPEVRACPEVGQYLHTPLAQLANQVPREMEGVAKRLFCDGYMYLYQSRTMSLYR